MRVRTSVLALDQSVRAVFDIGDGLELWLDERRLGLRPDDRTVHLRVTGERIPDELTAVRVRGRIGEVAIDTTLDPEPNATFMHVWNPGAGDADRLAPTSVTTDLEIGWEMEPSFPRPARTTWWTRRVTFGGADLRNVHCGGITPAPIHQLDVAADVVWRGNGSRIVAALERSSAAIRRLRTQSDEIVIADGALAHVFDRDGRFRRTLTLERGTVLVSAKADEEGLLTSWIDGGNRYTIDRHGDREALFRSPAGVWGVVDFDDQGRAVAVSDQTKAKATLEWSDSGGLASIVESNGLITKIERDDRGRVTRFVDSTGRQLDLTRNDVGSGSEVTVVTAEGREARYRVEQLADGSTVETQTCCGASRPRVVERRSLGPLGEERVVHEPDGTIATTHSGSRTDDRRAIEVARTIVVAPTGRALTSERRLDISRSGRTSDRLTVGESTWQRVLDADGHTITERTPQGRESSTSVTPGTTVEIATPNGGATEIRYDDHGRPKHRRHEGSEVTFGYDHNGRLTWTDFERWRQQVHHDEPGRVIGIETPDGWIQFARDDAGRVVGVKAPNDEVTAIDRRPDGAIEAIRYPTIDDVWPAERMTYDLDGLLVERRYDDEHVIGYERDEAGRVASVKARGVDVQATYDAASGRLAGLATAMGDTVRYLYDGDMPFAEVAAGRAGGSVERRYDHGHRVVGRSVNRAHELDVRRDPDGLVTGVGPLHIERSPAGAVVALGLGGLTTTRWYDSAGRLAGHETRFGKLKKVYFWQDIERDSLGRIIEISEHGPGFDRVLTYGYNDQRRLAQVEIDDVPVLSLDYDGNGNLTEIERNGRTLRMHYDAGDRLGGFAGAPTTHDAAGNLVAIGEDGEVRRYGFDGLGRLVLFVDARKIAVEHVVDAIGRPIEITGTAVLPVRLLWDGDRPAATLQANGEVDIRFVDSGSGPAPEAMIRNGVPYLLVTDHLGSVRCVVNALDGDIVQMLDYDPLGAQVQNTAPGWQPFGFAGGIHEPSSGLVTIDGRAYDPFVGRWLTRDPLGFAGGQVNLYQFANGDPVNPIASSRRTAGSCQARGGGVGDAPPVANGEVSPVSGAYAHARPLTLDHVYLASERWRHEVAVAPTLGEVGELLTNWTLQCPDREAQFAKLAAIEAECAGGAPSGADAASPAVVGVTPEAWDFDASAWDEEPGFLETVGRIMKLAASAGRWLPSVKPDSARLADSLPDT